MRTLIESFRNFMYWLWLIFQTYPRHLQVKGFASACIIACFFKFDKKIRCIMAVNTIQFFSKKNPLVLFYRSRLWKLRITILAGIKFFKKSQIPEVTIDFTQITLLKICKQSSIFILQVWAKSVEEKCNRNNVKSCKQIMNWLVYKLGRYLFCYCFHRRYRSTTLHVAGCIS